MKMFQKCMRIAVIWTALVFMAVSQLSASTVVSDSMEIGGYMRKFKMYLPDGLKKDAPLVMVCNGYGMKWHDGFENVWMNETADKYGFGLCVPCGLQDPRGSGSWNVGYPWQDGWQVNDVNMICILAQKVAEKYQLSKENHFLTGMSNGGELCYLTAYSNQHTFKAIGSLAGLTMKWFIDDLEIPRAIPFMEVHGTQDHTSEWNGDLDNKGGWGPYVATPIAIGQLVAKAHSTYEVTEELPVKDPSNGHRCIKHSYLGGRDGVEIWLYELIGGDHSWGDKDINPGEELWKFFSKYVK